jgi:membrane-associated protein
MYFLTTALSYILHIDEHLNTIIHLYGTQTYFLLMFIVFMETGFVVTPFLPGDSLLFATGALAAIGSLNIITCFVLLLLAVFLGDNTNYWIGHLIGPKAFSGKIKFLNQESLAKTHAYFEKYGGKTVIMARFIPIVRTFSPFVAGVGAMTYPRFLLFSIAGSIMWVTLFLFGGYFFGNLPTVKHNFTLVILAIIIISILPAINEYRKNKSKPKPNISPPGK